MSTIKANIIDSTTTATEFKDTITANGDKQWVDSYGVIKTNRTTIAEDVTIPSDTNGLSADQSLLLVVILSLLMEIGLSV